MILVDKYHRVLVLNKLWTALRTVSLQRAVGLLFSEYADGTPKARIIDKDELDVWSQYTWADWSRLRPKEEELAIASAGGLKFKVPSVILLSRYDKLPSHDVNFSRKTIYRRDKYRCQYCGCSPGSEELTIDHIIPKSQGGKTTWLNCCVACVACNSQKANRRPEESFKPKDKQKARLWTGPSPMKLRREPVKPKRTLFKGDPPKVIPVLWETFISEMYWNVELYNENEDDFDTQ
jgi:hypothetical protein